MNKFNLKEDDPNIYEKSSYQWIIYQFSDICDKYKNGFPLVSPKFPKTESKTKWKIRLYPNGDRENECIAALFLVSWNIHTYFAKYLLRIETSEDELIFESNSDRNFKSYEIWGYRTNLSPDTLKSKLKGDILKIHAIIWTELLTLKPHHRTNISQEKNTIRKLKVDFQMMFNNKKFTDFVIKLNDSCELPVHKSILAARSPVFSAMFENDTFENKVGHVEISDIDKDTMMLLLNFIYTGILCSDTSEEIIRKLLPAADKYELLDLKQLCEEILAENLKISNAADILLLSDMHNAFALRNSAFAYIVENMKCFSDQTMFLKLENASPDLLVQLLKHMNHIYKPITETS